MRRRRPQPTGRSLLDFAPDAVRLRTEGPRPHRPTLEYRLTLLAVDGLTILTDYFEDRAEASHYARQVIGKRRQWHDTKTNETAPVIATVLERCESNLEYYEDVTAETYGDAGAIVAAGFTPQGAE